MTKRATPKYVYAKGKYGYLYFVRNGVCTRIKAPIGTADFAAEYALLMRGREVVTGKTMAKLVDAYRRSPHWANLASNTRKSYNKTLDWLLRNYAQINPASIKRRHINEMRDALADTPTTANRRLDAMSALLGWARDNEWLEANVAFKVKRLAATGRKRLPWPEDMVDAFRAEADTRTLLIFEMLIGTGQRIGDVLNMKWGDVVDDGILVTPQKTRKSKPAPIFIPFTNRLREVINATPKRGLYIITQANGSRVSYNLAWKDFMAIRVKIGAERFDIHGLRHYAASQIAAIDGMTMEHVKAITGHASDQVARLYTMASAQRARAKEAQEKRQ